MLSEDVGLQSSFKQKKAKGKFIPPTGYQVLCRVLMNILLAP